ncbi:uncharacterized protein SPSK_04553 [Sporothrix schenckii 1099-18]|uniref:Uncharacterized protein n=1 Tax=Sporothrix schenckii 1099-18 TaxID=1397361 RepID=A0A0F2M334_SPOSC|nr:uncharacterized protein SPSK_04553 [Sporothrix schenckii 1099-18]KJR83509.1 hypothetical protein SPSK_04553 [Sporothrix schenckii 1099-18]
MSTYCSAGDFALFVVVASLDKETPQVGEAGLRGLAFCALYRSKERCNHTIERGCCWAPIVSLERCVTLPANGPGLDTSLSPTSLVNLWNLTVSCLSTQSHHTQITTTTSTTHPCLAGSIILPRPPRHSSHTSTTLIVGAHIDTYPRRSTSRLTPFSPSSSTAHLVAR